MLESITPIPLVEDPLGASNTSANALLAPSRRIETTRTSKAYGLLVEQPVSLVGLSQQARAQVVVSALLNEAGQLVILSRVGDMVWDLSPFVDTSNVRKSQKCLNWARIPAPYREACQNMVYAYWKLGREGCQAPGVTSLKNTLGHLAVFCRYLQLAGLERLADVQPLHVNNYVHRQKSGKCAASTLTNKFLAIEVLHIFRKEHKDGLQFHPWPDSSATHMAGDTGPQGDDARKGSLTPLIPAEVAKPLFIHAEGILGRAGVLLDERDVGARSAFADPEITAIRNACAYLIGVLTGVRNSEMSSIEVGAGRTEHKGGYTFHWLTAFESKTGKGLVDYLMPSMCHSILAVMERWSKPYRERLDEQIRDMEQQATHSAEDLLWLASARVNRRRLFLGNRNSGLVPVSNAGWNVIFKQFALDAGTTWELASHQLRRLYAYTFVKHKLGTLLFLKEQFKHSSINMGQLYAANPRQDASLYDDILDELYRQKAEVISAWLDKDEPLAGGAGKRLKELRAHDFPGRRELIMETSKRVLMRSTGHAWCLAQDGGCGGSGIYEKRACADCGNGVIDSVFAPIWLEGYRHHKELLKDAENMGPGFTKRVKSDLEREAKVLRDLGLDPDAADLEQEGPANGQADSA